MPSCVLGNGYDGGSQDNSTSGQAYILELKMEPDASKYGPSRPVAN